MLFRETGCTTIPVKMDTVNRVKRLKIYVIALLLCVFITIVMLALNSPSASEFVQRRSFLKQVSAMSGVIPPDSGWERLRYEWAISAKAYKDAIHPKVFMADAVKTDTSSTVKSLPDGYKDAKWGMSMVEVKKAIHAPVISNSGHEIQFDLGNNKTLVCAFYEDQLCAVFYDPSLQYSDNIGAETILTSLKEKYGDPEPFHSTEILQRKLVVGTMSGYRWSDGTSFLTYSWLKSKTGLYEPCTVEVWYVNLKLFEESRKKVHELKDQARQQAEKAKDERLRQLKDDL